MPSTTLGDFLNWAEATFLDAGLCFGHGTNNAWDEAVAIALAILDLPADVDRAILGQVLTNEIHARLVAVAERRVEARIPVPYLTHQAWFGGLKFYVDERVIIPRSPLAEFIERRCQPWLKANRLVHRILDLCTGSGCIAIALAYAFPEAQIEAIDVSSDALAVAKQNIALHNCHERIRLIQSDLFEACADQQYDIIISNPPYVTAAEMKNLPSEYHWEPILALEAGEDGLRVVHRILEGAATYLAPQGLLVVEVGNSEEALQKAYPQTPFTWLAFERGGQGVFLLNAKDKACWAIY